MVFLFFSFDVARLFLTHIGGIHILMLLWVTQQANIFSKMWEHKDSKATNTHTRDTEIANVWLLDLISDLNLQIFNIFDIITKQNQSV